MMAARQRAPIGHVLSTGDILKVSCEHRRLDRGMCGSCSARLYARTANAEMDLQAACGWAFDQGRRQA